MSLKFGYDINYPRKSECSNNSTKALVGTKSDDKTADTAFGRIEKNKDDIAGVKSIVAPANAQEGTPNLKGTQLSHASAIAAHSNNLLELENSVGKLVPKVKSLDSLVGTKADAKTTDTAFGKIKKIENNIGDIDEITNSTAIEKVSTSYWWLFDVSLRQRRLEVCSRGRRTNRRLHRRGNGGGSSAVSNSHPSVGCKNIVLKPPPVCLRHRRNGEMGKRFQKQCEHEDTKNSVRKRVLFEVLLLCNSHLR